jgi:hypothetical protein
VHKIKTAKSIVFVIAVATCFAAVSMQPLDIFPSAITPSLQLFEYVSGEEDQGSEEEAYLKFVSSASQQQLSGNSTNTTIPIPETAKGPAIPSEKGYLVQEIGNQLYSVSDGNYNVMFLVTDEGVVAIDAPPSLGEKYLKAIAEITDKPVSHVIYSHAHLDHIGAAGMFPMNATFISQQETANELQRAMSVATNKSAVPPVPTVTFPKNMTPNQKVLMLVDVIFPGWVPFAYLGIAKDVAGFIEAHDIALNNYDFDTIVAGHLTRLGTRADVEVQKEFVLDLERAAARANQNVSFMDIASRVGFDDPWLLFSQYFDAINKECEAEMLPKWESRLGGANAFLSTNCIAMSASGRVDPTVQALFQGLG